MAQRLPAYYYCSTQEILAGRLEEPGVPIDADLSDPRIRQKPAIFLTPGAPSAAGLTPMSRDEIDALLNDYAEGDARLSTDDTPAYTPPPLPGRGWTPDNQRDFLAALAEGYTVESACRWIGLSVQSAYKLRRSAAGAAFALGWNAAVLQYRHKLADTLMSRALDGQKVTTIRPDGSEVVRHFYDNRLGLATLSRLDRLADEAKADGTFESARLVAQDFDAYLDMISAGASPARAGLFLARRTTLELTGDYDDEDIAVADATAALWSSPQLAPVAALARADLYTRTGASLPQEIVTSDLDYDKRAEWTAEQWQRAHARGLLSPLPFKEGVVGGCVRQEDEEREETDAHGNLNPPKPPRPTTGTEGRIWFDAAEEVMMTNFPPPQGFEEYQSHGWGHPEYERVLSYEEEELVEARRIDQMIAVYAPDAALRDKWFAAVGDGTADVLALYAPEADGPPSDAGEEASAEVASEVLPPASRPGADAPHNRKSRRTAAARRRTRRKGGDAGVESAHVA